MSEFEKTIKDLLQSLKDSRQDAKKPLITYNTFSESEQKLLVKFCHAAPAKFLEEIERKKISETLELFKPQDSPDVDTMKELSKEIWEKFVTLKQTPQQLTNKLLLWKSLNSIIKSEFPKYGLFIAGSTLNGFGLQTSDIDLSLITTEKVELNFTTSLDHLKKLARLLSQKYNDIDSIEIVEAKVPLIKFHETKYNFNVDINFNITSNIQNTHLLHCYSQVDWRVSPLVTLIKQWAKTQDLLDAKYGSLSSYPLVLMVIHFLQACVKPKILPSLQKCLEKNFQSTVKCIDYFNEIEVPFTELYPMNKQSLGELFIQFFEYYEKFEFSKYVISIREGEKILLTEYTNPMKYTYSSRYIFIEEPFNSSNVGESVFKLTTFEKIKSTFEKTYLKLKTTRNLSDILDKSFN